MDRRAFLKLVAEGVKSLVVVPTVLKVAAALGISTAVAVGTSGCGTEGPSSQGNPGDETGPVVINPEVPEFKPDDEDLYLILQEKIPATTLIDCMNMKGPGNAPSEAEAMEFLSNSGCKLPEDATNSDDVWRQVVEDPQILSLTTLALPSLATPGPVDDLILAGLILTTAGLVAYTALKASKEAQSGKHTDASHNPYNPRWGGPARDIINQIMKGGKGIPPVLCWTVKFLNREGIETIRTILTVGVLNNPYLTSMAWYEVNQQTGVPTAWGGAYTYKGNPNDFNALQNTVQGIGQLIDQTCKNNYPPAP
jgi:hypothetical protein